MSTPELPKPFVPDEVPRLLARVNELEAFAKRFLDTEYRDEASLALGICKVCGEPHQRSPNGYAHPTKCWKCAPSRLPLKHGIRKFGVLHPRKTRKH